LKKPWNIPNLPVYSLATYSEKLNMNICTYVSAVSMKPKIYAIGVYENTKTLESIEKTNFAVLQLLSASQYKLVNYLGKKSGLMADKEKCLKSRNLITNWENYEVLKDVSALVLLQKTDKIQTGDHTLFVFNTLKYRSYHSDILTTSILSEQKIIRI
jgi:flavin reductase (DIM6/NTAB) family NADH-FMN oxidoreductase RutF